MEEKIMNLEKIVEEQGRTIARLEFELDGLKKWSDLNDFWLREMIDALTDSVDKLMGLADELVQSEDYEE